jgi:tetratricopeptide (TPR) repeat protein
MPEQPESEMRGERLAALLQESAKVARWRERSFWALSLIWVAVVFAVGAFFSYQLVRFGDRQERLDAEVRDQLRRISDLSNNYNALQGSVDRLRSAQYAAMNSEAKQKYAVSLAQAVVARREITDAEKQILAAQSKATESGGSVEAMYIQGATELTQAKPEVDSAIEKLKGAVKRNPQYAPAQTALGRAYEVAGQYETSQRELEKAIELAKTAPNYAARCWPLVRLGRFDEAVRDCSQAVRLDGGYWPSYNYRGFAYYQLNRDKEAEDDWRTAARLRDEPYRSLENLGLIYLRRKDWRLALSHAEQVNAMNRRRPWNWLFLSIAAEQLGRSDEARQALAEWSKLKSPADVDSLKYFLPRELQFYLSDNPRAR